MSITSVTALEGLFVGAATGALVAKATHRKVMHGAAVGAVMGYIAGAVIDQMDPETVSKTQTMAMQVFLAEMLALILITQAEKTQVVKHCITEYNEEQCPSAAKKMALGTIENAGAVLKGCAKGFTPGCAAAAIQAVA